MVNSRSTTPRDAGGRFYGARLNLEFIPRLPALAMRTALDDPLRRSYLFAWKLDGRPINGVGEIAKAVVVRRHNLFREWPRGPSAELWSGPENQQSVGWSEIGTLFRRLPHGAGAELLLLCAYCEKPKRYLYCWAKDGHCRYRSAGGWICRRCAGLSFASEGQQDPLGSCYPRPEPWSPYVFFSVEDGCRFLRRFPGGYRYLHLLKARPEAKRVRVLDSARDLNFAGFS